MKKQIIFLACAAVAGAACENTNSIPAVSDFQIERYMGKWYETARLPNWFERGMDKVTAEYSLNEDGTVKVVNSGFRDGEVSSVSGIARFAGEKDTGELEVSFFRPFYSPYRIIYLTPDYSYSVVTGSDPDYLWILAREPEMDDRYKDEIFVFLEQNGFDTKELICSWE